MDIVVDSEVIMNDLIYIEPDSMREYKKQCEEVCQNQMTAFTILRNIDNFSFGFLHVSTKASIGGRRLSISDRQSLNGFVFCDYLEKQREILISIVCSRKHMRLGRKLMQAVEQEALELGVTRLTLNSLAEEKLRKWYESLGFELLKENPIPYGPQGVKSYYMAKML